MGDHCVNNAKTVFEQTNVVIHLWYCSDSVIFSSATNYSAKSGLWASFK